MKNLVIPAPARQTTPPPFHATAVTWPKAASATAALSAPTAGKTTGARTPVPGTPVWAEALAPDGHTHAGGKISVHVLDHSAAAAAGVSGVLFTVQGTDNTKDSVRIGLDYSAFSQAYGGNYGDRLHLVELPACALTTPQVASCRTPSPITTRHEQTDKSISAALTLAPSATATQSAATRVLAVATDTAPADGGPAGTYSADSLKPSGSWTAGSSTGTFGYDYPIALPASSSPLVPSVDLSYDSGSIDGQTSSTQAQASWAGDGWGTPDSFIEQTFASCSDSPEGTASPVSTSDSCYAGPVLTVSLGGKSTSLVYNATTKTYTPADDDGEKVTHFTNTANGSGTYNTDYWTVTDRDGTTYTFGRNELPGWTTGKPTTNSVDSEPVYSAHSGDPCYSSSGFTASVCTMAYRWHLDYAVDTHGNAISYYYTQATNYYGQDNGAKSAVYTRDSYLDHIDYGFRDGGAFGTIADKVVFNAVPRCTLATCTALSSTTAATQYPDVPYDVNCAKGATCTNWGPSFYSTVRLSSISTEQYLAGTTYQGVDSYQLDQSEPATGDGTSPTLWLKSILHIANDTTAGGSTAPITLPKVIFQGIDLPNRVDTSNFPGLYRWRVNKITSEMGGTTGITYDTPYPCTASYVATAIPSTNTKSCYPSYWTPKDYTAPVRDWFEKYSVSQVLETDSTGGSQAKRTDYTYSGGAAWHFDDNELVKAKYRTFGQFRGYGTVETRVGDIANDPQTKSVTDYYRGMDADWLTSTSSRSVTLTDSQGGTHTDSDQLAGNALETTVYKGDGGPVDHSTITSYWISPAVATRARTGVPDLTANLTAEAETFTRQALTDGGTTRWQYNETDDSYNDDTASATFGLLQHSYSHTVPANTAYDECASTAYAPANTGENLVGLPALQETDSVACGGFTEAAEPSSPAHFNTLTAPASVSRPDQVESASQTFYDDTDFSTAFPQAAAPTLGNVTMTRQASGYSSGAFTWQTTQRQTHDGYGRTADSYDGNGNKTATSYTVSSAGLTTGQKVVNAKSQTATVTFAPTRALALTSTDANGITTTKHYDAAGRTTSVWLDSRPTSAPANDTSVYTVSGTSLSGVTTSTLNDNLGYATSVTVYDSFGRTRQTQTPTPQGGRLVTESFYDSWGLVRKTNNAYWDPGTTPALALASAQDSIIPSQDLYTYDGLGQVVTDESDKYSVAQETTTTVYNGDTTTVIPPPGGVINATTTDPLGRTTVTKEYTAPPTVTAPANSFTGIAYTAGGTADATTYGYDGHGMQSTTTHAGSTWTTTNNLLGLKASSDDPDAGRTSYLYDADGNVTQTTDARGDSVSFTYDVLDRKTAEYAATTAAQATGNEMASWVYDNDNAVTGVTDAVGKVTTSTAFNDGSAYTEQAVGFNVFGESLGETVTIPSAQGGVLGRSYTFKQSYSANTGLLTADNYPAAGGLPAEIVAHTYATALDLPNGLADTSYGYSQGTTYDAYGRPVQEVLGQGNNEASINNTFDVHTGALTDQLITRTTAAPSSHVDEQAYTYDKAGNTTRQTSTRFASTTSSETQCYRYDGLDRLTTAWTATDNCAATPSASDSSTIGDALGASSAYWTSWTFNDDDQRSTQTQHATTAGGADTTTSYAHDGNGQDQPHTLTGDTTANPATGSSTDSYGYDADGDMTTRNTATGNQTLNWNAAGQLTSVTTASSTVSYLYDADGSLLLQIDPTTKTLYLPGEQITLDTTADPATATGVRYLPLPGGGTVVRTGTGTNYSFEIGDPHGTSDLYLDYTAQNPTWRQFTPYGAPRGTTTAWIDNRGFLNKPTDPVTGLTAVGARQYDPSTGAFISLDPVFEAGDPTQLNGYDYAGDNPVTNADPTGNMLDGGGSGGDGPSKPTRPITGDSGGTGDGERHGFGPHAPIESNGHSQEVSTPANPVHHNWVDDHSVSGNTTTVSGQLDLFSPNKTSHLEGGYWAPFTNANGHMETVCYGRLACSMANHYLLGHTNDVAGAQVIAATYCLVNQEQCEADAAQWNVTSTLYGQAAQLLSGGEIPDLGQLDDVAAATQAGAKLDAEAAGECSFTPDTPVLLADGTTKPIGNVKLGDKVQAADPETGKDQGTRPVTATFINHDNDLIDLTIQIGPGHTAVVHTTSKHPFWDDTTHTWVPAGHLTPGHALETASNSHALVRAVRAVPGAAAMYNLTVNQLHTYYVLAGATPVLVHNCTVAASDHYVPSPEEAQKIIQNAPRGSSAAVKSDPYHRAPIFMQDQIAERGTVWRKPQRDPMNPDNPMHVSMPGEVNGKSGIFHWIVDRTGTLVHEAFEPGRG
ncbi:polymorphic toxin-type HINT domain-containing protein [Streptomyces sp. DvalAA-14]|uniref:polymorphic toxin-type HINT domain-containing protein n=1 Tax=Streptomyces sp. DvalAA-14 TaxID=1839759 RepID=UPI000B80823C|nr:polymorphic toxin-type HINT domain-containing protein [Streptomyces sp. DvalAA-14]